MLPWWWKIAAKALAVIAVIALVWWGLDRLHAAGYRAGVSATEKGYDRALAEMQGKQREKRQAQDAASRQVEVRHAETAARRDA